MSANRKGLLCEIEGHAYHHTGCQYWLIRDNGPSQFDLRQMPGGRRLEVEFSTYDSLLHGGRWRQAAAAQPHIQEALKTLTEAAEDLWWAAVIEFLTNHHRQVAMRSHAFSILFKAGFSADEIHSLQSAQD